MYEYGYRFALGDYPPRADRVWTAVTIAMLGSGATVAAAVLLDQRDEVARLWWVPVGVAVACGAVSVMSALILSSNVEAAATELTRAADRGDLAVAVALDRALQGRRPRRWQPGDADEDEDPAP